LPLGLPIRVVSTPVRLEPGVFGIFRPVLLLPEGIAGRLTQAQLQAVLAHELCHVRRRDNLAAAVHMLIEALFWFYPLVWWLGARLMDERERACDEEVLRLGGKPEAYAEGILNVCKCYMESPVACVSGISGSDLKKRIVRIMTQRLPGRLTLGRKLLLATIGIAAVAGPLVFGLLAVPPVQSPAIPQWQIAAGGTMAFEVASVKQDTAEPSPSNVSTNVPPGDGDYYTPNGGLFTATNMPLFNYIMFAYKVSDSQAGILRAQVPKWVLSARFDIQARALGNPTKDQMRLLMQTLLADRFKLATHRETRRLPVFDLVQSRPGKTGPQLQTHSANTSCSSVPDSPAAAGTVAGGFPLTCGGIQPMQATVSGRVRIGGRNVSMGLIASTFPAVMLDSRPVLDRTGLSGTFDFALEWTPEPNGPLTPSTSFQADESGPEFLEALKDQLGLKLEATTGPVDALFIDHVEEPSPN
jgi:bla regulator protein blaR1